MGMFSWLRRPKAQVEEVSIITQAPVRMRESPPQLCGPFLVSARGAQCATIRLMDGAQSALMKWGQLDLSCNETKQLIRALALTQLIDDN